MAMPIRAPERAQPPARIAAAGHLGRCAGAARARRRLSRRLVFRCSGGGRRRSCSGNGRLVVRRGGVRAAAGVLVIAGRRGRRRSGCGRTRRAVLAVLGMAAASPSRCRASGLGWPPASPMRPRSCWRRSCCAPTPRSGLAGDPVPVRGRLGDRHRRLFRRPRDRRAEALARASARRRPGRARSAALPARVAARSAVAAVRRRSASAAAGLLALRAVGRLAGRRSVRIRAQAPLRRQGFRPAHSRATAG